MPDLLTDLRDAIGDEHVLTDAADVSAYAADWRGAYRGTPLAVLRPGSTAEVSRVVSIAHAAGVAVVPPYAGKSGWVGAYLDRRPNWRALTDLLWEAYRLAAPKTLLARLDSAQPARRPRTRT